VSLDSLDLTAQTSQAVQVGIEEYNARFPIKKNTTNVGGTPFFSAELVYGSFPSRGGTPLSLDG